MLSIDKNVKKEFIIKKSKFITFVYNVNSDSEVNEILKNLKKDYKDATHICYAYIINNIKRFDDDNEPNKTAGMPILTVLENKNLSNILCVIVRYFGGIKLGASGLTRAYASCARETINESKIINLVCGKIIKIWFCYENSKLIDNLVKDYNIISKTFNEDICYELIVNNEDIEKICYLKEIKKYEIIKDTLLKI